MYFNYKAKAFRTVIKPKKMERSVVIISWFVCFLRYYGSGILIPELLEGKRILDMGCGSGSLVFILSKLTGPNGYVVGVDLCDEEVRM